MTVLSKINIGNIVIDEPIFLAPMCGISDYPFRKIVSKFSDNLKFSEMIASFVAINDLNQLEKKSYKKNDNEKLAIQLVGYDPVMMSEAAKINENLGADIIDINFGCPVKKVVNSFCGSAIMKNESLVAKIIESVVNTVKIPVTIKTRIGWDENNKNVVSIAKIAENCGAKMITVHARTRSQMFNGNADWEFVKNVKDVIQIPVIINGDIKTENDALNSLKLSNADGIMIGRGSYGKPWIIRQISDFLFGKKFEPPNKDEVLKIILEHIDLIIDFYGTKTGISFVKKHLMYYSNGIKLGSKFRADIASSNDYGFIKSRVFEIFD